MESSPKFLFCRKQKEQEEQLKSSRQEKVIATFKQILRQKLRRIPEETIEICNDNLKIIVTISLKEEAT